MGCTTQINKYRSGTNKLRDEFGPDFWTVSSQPPPACDPIPAAGRTIDETDACFQKRGSPASWYAGDRGMNGACLFTYTTDDPAPDNNASWQLSFDADGSYAVEVYTDGGDLGQSHQAKYIVEHAGGTTEVVIDQTAAADFQRLGTFDFTAGTVYSVTLGDNTGEPYDPDNKIGIMFDAVRIVAASGTPDGDGDADGDGIPDSMDESGGCATGGGSNGALVLFALGALIVRIRRK
jgi:MYXO-CTERM domain-containing protein